jgi:hypothetical protein
LNRTGHDVEGTVSQLSSKQWETRVCGDAIRHVLTDGMINGHYHVSRTFDSSFAGTVGRLRMLMHPLTLRGDAHTRASLYFNSLDILR